MKKGACLYEVYSGNYRRAIAITNRHYTGGADHDFPCRRVFQLSATTILGAGIRNSAGNYSVENH